MIKILKKIDALRSPLIFTQMFSGRAATFKDRLGWDVVVRNGLEIDSFDIDADPVYIVALDPEDRVYGSLRILPGNGPTLLSSDFGKQFLPTPHVLEGEWECTRFCVHSSSQPDHSIKEKSLISSYLLEGLCQYALHAGITSIIAIFDKAVHRVYTRIGWIPTVIGQSQKQPAWKVGRWVVSLDTLDRIQNARSGRQPAFQIDTRDYSTSAPELRISQRT